MNDAALLAVLAEMRDEIRALRLAVERGRKEPDPALVANLLRAIDATIGARDFTCADLMRHAEQVSEQVAADLHAAIIGAVGGANLRKLGKLLHSVQGREIGGLEVHALSAKDRNGVIWKVIPAGLRV